MLQALCLVVFGFRAIGMKEVMNDRSNYRGANMVV